MLGVIMAGGKGSRLGAGAPPKALVPIGHVPLLVRVADQLRGAGVTRLLVATGHRGPEVAAVAQHHGLEPVDTGPETPNGGRLLALAPKIGQAPFLMAWCDGLTDADLTRLEPQRQATGALVTLLAVHPPERFGRLDLEGDLVRRFAEKERDRTRWINGGIFAMGPEVFDDLTPESSVETDLLPRLVARGAVSVLRHGGAWTCVDTGGEAAALNAALGAGQVPWLGSERAPCG